MTEEQLSALLRLKRFEQPPPGYFDDLLRNIHQRQRTELLRRPLWRIAMERMQTFFGEHSMSPVSYAGAMATLTIFGVTVISVMGPPNGGSSGKGTPTLASTNVSATSPATPILQLQTPLPAEPTIVNWDSTRPTTQSKDAARHPRYVIDARPVSYEAPFRF